MFRVFVLIAILAVPLWAGDLERTRQLYERMEYEAAVRALGAARGLTRFVGRQTELAALCQALDHARAGYSQVVLAAPGGNKLW
jgi:ribonuclease HI